MLLKVEDIKYTNVREPDFGLPSEMPEISKETFEERQNKILKLMKDWELDYVFVYADREHYGNFEYLANFGPRFEEALLIMDSDGKIDIILGNENIGMEKYCKLGATGHQYHPFSLPNQPILVDDKLKDILEKIGVKSNSSVGLVGWSIFDYMEDEEISDIPEFITKPTRDYVADGKVINATAIFMDPDFGARAINNAEEIAFFEFNATYASDAVQKMLLNAQTNMTEIEISQYHTAGTLPTTIFPKTLAGDSIDVNMTSATTNVARLGDRFQASYGLIGGQTNRRGFFAYDEEDIVEEARDWMERYAYPTFMACANWYEQIAIGKTGDEIYQMIEEIFPKEEYGWFLNPGHLIAVEEWMSTPFYEGSKITIKSGMVMQMDILVSVESNVYAGPDFEDGVAIADKDLREEIKTKFPETYDRFMARRKFMEEELGYKLHPEILPMSNLTGLYRPFMLNKDKAFVIDRK